MLKLNYIYYLLFLLSCSCEDSKSQGLLLKELPIKSIVFEYNINGESKIKLCEDVHLFKIIQDYSASANIGCQDLVYPSITYFILNMNITYNDNTTEEIDLIYSRFSGSFFYSLKKQLYFKENHIELEILKYLNLKISFSVDDK